MLVLGLKPGHDGGVAAVHDHEVLFSLEGEKDSALRHARFTPEVLIRAAEHLGEVPDVVALGGWESRFSPLGEGYSGYDSHIERPMSFFGKQVTFFSSSHERSHIAMAIGMAPKDGLPQRALLIWEGEIGSLYLVDGRHRVEKLIPVLKQPGARWGSLFALADPIFPDKGRNHRAEDAGKLMALAGFGDPESSDPQIVETVDRLVSPETNWYPTPKASLRDSPVYNAGVEAQVTKDAAALLSKRIFDLYADAALEHLPGGIPLHISGGCGLNCEWNAHWRELGHFSSVFVPPCADDSGSALGTAIDAVGFATGDPFVEWDVYSGLEFRWDAEPDSARWRRRALEMGQLADAIAAGGIVAWVQGRWEIGPRALGNRSILAEPFKTATRDRLNDIKLREPYRPIAPCCRAEDAAQCFDRDFEDPYMLYFRRVLSPELGAVTHVDGSARVQTVTREGNAPLHRLLTAFAERHGMGVLCNTSLNFKGRGFINSMSTLADYCERRGLDGMIVGDVWFERAGDHS